MKTRLRTAAVNRNLRAGFSLLELSIVLVIIGLLAGGVMTGQSLIRAAELRSVVTEFQKYTTALNAFRDKYQAIPGDFKIASSFWGLNATCPGISTTTASAATCNGDGDGSILATVSTSNENYRFWQHLALAGLIEGTFTGTANSTTASDLTSLPGGNVPSSKITNAGWRIYKLGTVDASSLLYFEGNYGHILQFASMDGSSTLVTNLKPEEMWNIDSKLDDGKPGLGLVTAPEGGTNCHDQTAGTSALAGVAAYKLSSTAAGCWGNFKLPF